MKNAALSATIRKDSLWNVAGSIIPLAAAALTIPYLLHSLGQERFGILTLLWALIGYFGILDAGVGRALTYEVSVARRSSETFTQIGSILVAGMIIVALTGVAGSVLLLVASGSIVHDWLRLPDVLRGETIHALHVTAFGLVLVTSYSSLRGATEGLGKFALSNKIKALLGTSLFVAPAVSIMRHGPDLVYIAAYLVSARACALLVNAYFLRSFVDLGSFRDSLGQIKKILSYGVWVTLSGLLSPIMVYGDRFVIAALSGAGEVQYYAIPQEGIQRLLILPVAVCTAMLPRIPLLSRPELKDLYQEMNSRIRSIMVMAVIGALVLGYPVLSWWISPAFASVAFPVVVISLVGVLFNAFAQLPYYYLQATGRPGITALLHLLEFVFYMLTIGWFVAEWGARGAAVAWALRVMIDWMLLRLVVSRDLHDA